MPEFPTERKPDYPIEETPAEPDVLISRHRDGSQQRRLKGAKGRTFRLSYTGLTTTEKDALVTHYDGQDGSLTAWTWTHPETAVEHLVIYREAPAFRAVGYNQWEGELSLEVVPA